VTSVEFGWYSSMVGVLCCGEAFCRAWLRDAASRVAAACGRTNRKITAAKMTESNARVRQDFMICLCREAAGPIFPQEGASMRAGYFSIRTK
jgi:hypothetical protein